VVHSIEPTFGGLALHRHIWTIESFDLQDQVQALPHSDDEVRLIHLAAICVERDVELEMVVSEGERGGARPSLFHDDAETYESAWLMRVRAGAQPKSQERAGRLDADRIRNPDQWGNEVGARPSLPQDNAETYESA
jgi:hypothetical protein